MDPRFLTKGILADFFNHDPNLKAKRKNGIVKHSDLVHIWSRFKDRSDFEHLFATFIFLLEKFGVCFVVAEDKSKSFLEQRSIIPSLLPDITQEEINSKLRQVWPKDAPFNRSIEIERILKFNLVPSELVSRLLVRLHPHIQNGLVWKNDVVIFMESENTQSWIRADIPLKKQEVSGENHQSGDVVMTRFVVTIRGSDLGHCRSFLNWIVDQVKTVSLEYPSIQWKEAVRSPHDSETEIELEEVIADARLSLDQRKLFCPATNLPILAEKLLMRTGFIDKISDNLQSTHFFFLIFHFSAFHFK